MQSRSRTWALWVFAALSMASVGILVVLKYSSGNTSVSFDRSSETAMLDRAKAGLEDSDGDGLKDWEESLWGTNPNSPDTDGNGIVDGQEPYILAKKTGLPSSVVLADSTTASDTSLETNPSLTEILSYLALQDYTDTGSLDPNTLKAVANNELSSTFKFQEHYTAHDINITSDNSLASLVSYTNNLIDLVVKQGQKVTFDEVALVINVIESQDGSSLPKLDSTIGLYAEAIKDGLALEVPSNLAQYHLELLNSSWNAARYLSLTKNIVEDPLEGIAALQAYLSTLNKIHTSMASIDTYISNKGAVVNTATNHYAAP